MEKLNLNKLNTETKATLIEDMNFPLERARKLVDKESEELSLAFVSRDDVVSCDDIEEFASSKYEKVRMKVASKGNLKAESLMKLLYDTSDKVVINALSNNNVTEEIITKLVREDKKYLLNASFDVIIQFASTKNICYDDLYSILGYITNDIEDEAKRNDIAIKFAKRMLLNSNISEDILIELFTSCIYGDWIDEKLIKTSMFCELAECITRFPEKEKLIDSVLINEYNNIDVWKYIHWSAFTNLSQSNILSLYKLFYHLFNENERSELSWSRKEEFSFYKNLCISDHITFVIINWILNNVWDIIYYLDKETIEKEGLLNEVDGIFINLCMSPKIDEESVKLVYQKLKLFNKYGYITNYNSRLENIIHYSENCSDELKEIIINAIKD